MTWTLPTSILTQFFSELVVCSVLCTLRGLESRVFGGLGPSMAIMPAISEEGQERPRNQIHQCIYPNAATLMGNNLIMKEALAAHLEYVEVCGDEGYQPMEWEKTTSLPEDKREEYKLCSVDQRFVERVYDWLSEYTKRYEFYEFAWWERKPIDEIKSMLWEIPLSPDTYDEIVTLIEALKRQQQYSRVTLMSSTDEYSSSKAVKRRQQ